MSNNLHRRLCDARNFLGWCALIFISLPSLARAQDATALKQVLDRLDRLEKENRALADEVHALRSELALTHPPPAETPPLEERVEVNTQRLDDLAQTKVESTQKFPLRITGMALFNAFVNGKQNNGNENPVVAARSPGPATSGGTLRQSIIGLEYHGPQMFWGGKVSGSLYLDLFGGAYEAAEPPAPHLRVATLQIDWKNQSFAVGQDKPIVSPREPNSLAQVGVSPLTGAGNLWLWEPQARFEQRVHFGDRDLLRAQVGVFQTAEAAARIPAAFASTLEPARPGLEGRFEFTHHWNGASPDDSPRIEIAPGFHFSATHVAGTSVPSNLASLDWFINPLPKVEFTGMFFKGKNLAGLGALRQGFTILSAGNAIPVHGMGGWAQLRLLPTQRLSFNIYGGQHDDRDSDLRGSGIGKNQAYFGNFMYRIAPNVIVSFEAGQVRTYYIGSGQRLNNHYDLALAYLF
jgi:hypothetical protein